jgi:hypothetical protein
VGKLVKNYQDYHYLDQEVSVDYQKAKNVLIASMEEFIVLNQLGMHLNLRFGATNNFQLL